MQAMTDDKIQIRAYELWEQEGRPHGRAEEFWFRASSELANGNGVTKARKAAASKTATSKTAAPKSKTVGAKAATEPASKPKKKAAPKKSN